MLKAVYILVGDNGESYRELLDHDFPDGNEKALSWKNVYIPAGNVSIAITYFTKFVSFTNLRWLDDEIICFLCFCNS
jgi:hypothetical protein